jgi:hypothetical protein
MDVPQVSLKLIFRGREQPSLQSIRFLSGPDVYTAEAPQDRDLAKAVAVVLLLFRSYSTFPEMTLFRIQAAKPTSFIDTILNAKKSDLRSRQGRLLEIIPEALPGNQPLPRH